MKEIRSKIYLDGLNPNTNPTGSFENPFNDFGLACEHANINLDSEICILSNLVLMENLPIYISNNQSLSIYMLQSSNLGNSNLMFLENFSLIIENSSLLKISGMNFSFGENFSGKNLFLIHENSRLELENCNFNLTNNQFFISVFHFDKSDGIFIHLYFSLKNNNGNFSEIFKLERLSKLSLFSNYFNEINNLNGKIIAAKFNSQIIIENSIIDNCFFEKNHGVIETDNNITLNNLTVKNTRLDNISLLFLQNFNNSDLYVVINQSYFFNMTQSSECNIPLIMNLNFGKFAFILQDSFFEENLAYSYLILIDKSFNDINLKNLYFLNNYAMGIIYTNLAKDISCENIIILNQNNHSIEEGKLNLISYVKNGGTCFKFFNCMAKSFDNITISNSFSNYTAIGFQIIDINKEIQSLKKEIYYTNLMSLSITNSYFSNNFVFYEINQNSSGIFYIYSNIPIFMSNCYFYNNKLNSTSYPKYKIGSPCLNSFSELNTLIIENCLFGFNQAKFYSNCMTFFGSQLNLTNSYFFSNNPIFDILELIIYERFKSSFTKKLECHVNGNGGAILSYSEYFYISNCFFYNNSAYKGGAIIIESKILQIFLKVFIKKTVFLSNIAGDLGGGVDFGRSHNLYGEIEDCLFLKNDARFGGGLATEYDDFNNSLFLKKIKFIMNTGQYAAGLLAHHLNGFLEVQESVFYQNYAITPPNLTLPISGGAFGIWGTSNTRAIFSKNIYIKNKSDLQSGVFFIIGGNLLMMYENILNNTVGLNGIIFVSVQSILIMNHSTIRNSFSYYQGGCFRIADFSYLYLYNITIDNSSALDKGGIFSLYPNVFFIGINLTLINSYSKTGSILLLNEGNDCEIIFIDSIFQNNSALYSLFDVSESLIIFDNCIFLDNKNAIFFIEKTKFTMNSSKIIDLACDNEECFFISTKSSNVTIINSLFHNITTIWDNTVMISVSSQVTFKNNNFSKLFQSQASIFVSGSIFIMNDSFFSNNIPSCLYFSQSNVLITNVSFQNKGDFKGYSFIVLIDLLKIEIYDSIFQDNQAITQGGSIYAISSDKSNKIYVLKIKNSIFISCSSENEGGALYMYEITSDISYCIFNKNYALKGGSIYYQSIYENSNVSLHIKNSSFLNNTSMLGGGAIIWINRIPDIEYNSIIFSNNQAMYGNDIASDIIRIRTKVYSLYKNNTAFQLEYDSFLNTNINYSILDQKPGYILNKSLNFVLLDYYNQTVTSIENHFEIINVLPEKELDFLLKNGKRSSENLDNNSLKTFIVGKKIYSINKGILTIISSNSKIFTRPNSTLYILLKPTIFTKYSSYLKYPSEVEFKINNEYYIIIKMNISQCNVGEIIMDNYCYKCGPTEFSLNISDTHCKKCPLNAECKGGFEIILNSEYWRSSNLSEKIIFCQGSKMNCLGGFDSNCADIFYGPLCRSCPNEYYNINNQYCLYCFEKIWNIFRVGGMMIILFIVIIFLIKSTFDNNKIYDKLKGNNEKKTIKESDLVYVIDLQSIYIKILVNWIHMTSLLSVLPIDWPDYFAGIFNIFSFFTSISTKFMAFECVFSSNESGVLKPYMKAISVNIMPFILILMTLIFWKVYQKIKKTREIYDKIYASLIGIILMMQQNILNECLNSLSCIDIDGRQFLKNDPSYSCDLNIHFYLKNFFLWPIFMIWGFGIPLIIWFYLFMHRTKLYQTYTFKKVNFLYVGYKFKYFYWDILILLRKSFAIFIGMFLKDELNSQLMILLLIISVYLKYLRDFQPFLNRILNFLEIFGTSIILIGIILSLFINMMEDYKYKLIFYVFVMISQVCFLIIWFGYFFIYLLEVYRRLLKKKYPLIFKKLVLFIHKYRLRNLISLKRRLPLTKRITTNFLEFKRK